MDKDLYKCSGACLACENFKGEADSFRFAKKFLKEHQNALEDPVIGFDIGAHVGVYGYALTGNVSKMHSFEITPPAFKILQINAKNYPEIIPYNIAAWSERSFCEVVYPTSHLAGARICGQFEADQYRNDKNFVISTPVISLPLDELFPDPNLLINFIKIDVEGAELHVLKGLSQIISRSHTLCMIVEYAPSHYEKYNYTSEDLFKFFEENNLQNLTLNPRPLENLHLIKVQ